MSDEQTPPFKRTVCACDECVACCDKPGFLAPRDVERITEFLVKHKRIEAAVDVVEFFRASAGTIVGIRTRKGILTTAIPTITPKTGPDGHCIFLKDRRCTIHEVSPFGCAYYDTHMSGGDGDERTRWNIRAIAQSESYKAFRALLQDVERKEDAN